MSETDAVGKQYTVQIGNEEYVVEARNEEEARHQSASKHKQSLSGPDVGVYVGDLAGTATVVSEVEFPPMPMNTREEIVAHDAVLLDQEDLTEFVESVGGFEVLSDSVDVFTDDGFTRGKTKFNMIGNLYADRDPSFGVMTQIHDPFTRDDALLDLRRRSDDQFSDWILGLM